MIYGKAMNDMYRGWRTENELNKRIYQCWFNMIVRCYSENFQEKNNSYKGCYVCERWLKLSNFVDDISKIDNYELWKNNPNKKIALDKDIKSNGNNKCYCLEQCMFTTKSKNSQQAISTRNNEYLANRISYKNPYSKKIEQYDKNNNLIKIWNSIQDIKRELNINDTSITMCCKFYDMNCNKSEWFKKYKKNPYYSVGGFIWKYHKMNKVK